jgi:radical SAM superfamily enzyme YgiQ (UPF0313 family)
MRVALLCIDPWRWAESALQSHRPFNYAVRRIQAAILGNPALSFVDVQLIESKELNAEELLTRLEAFDPDVIGVSAYVWSFPILLETCRRAKRARPDRTIIFGGPSSRPEMFNLPQYRDSAECVDALVVGEGEDCIHDILVAPDRSRDTLLKIPGLAVLASHGWVSTGERRYSALEHHPSPYQMGLMQPPMTAQLESFRGCPLSCTYCEWGDTGVTPRLFSREYLVRELQAIERLKPTGIWLVDPGFNLSAKSFQNLRLAEAEVGALRRIGGFRCEVYPSHLTDEHLRFLEATQAQYAGIGLQSYDAEVLKGVERPFSPARFERVVGEVASIVPDTVVEVIMGLPGDNPDNFKRTLEKVLRLPVAVRVFHCLVLPSALMKRAPASFDLRYDPFTLKVISCLGWSQKDIEEMCLYLNGIARNEESLSVVNAGTWKFSRPGQSDGRLSTPSSVPVLRSPPVVASQPSQPEETAVAETLRDSVGWLIRDVTPWTLDRAVLVDSDPRKGVRLHVRNGTREFALRIVRARPGHRSYREVQGIAYSYESSTELPWDDVHSYDVLINRLHPVMLAAILGLSTEPAVALAPLRVAN